MKQFTGKEKFRILAVDPVTRVVYRPEPNYVRYDTFFEASQSALVYKINSANNRISMNYIVVVNNV